MIPVSYVIIGVLVVGGVRIILRVLGSAAREDERMREAFEKYMREKGEKAQ